jgi:predicted kinase
LEFNERLRCGDVAGDVAFLAMELEAEGRSALAAGFVARYADAADDFELYAVLDYFLSYRAWVRGKVAAIVARDPATPTSVRRAKESEARRDFALARSYAGRPAAPAFVIAVGGLIGSGKSTLAKALGDALAVPVISSDRIRKALAALAPTERGNPELYTASSRDRVYAEVLRLAETVARSGRGVVLDATFGERRWRAAAAAGARRAGAAFVSVEVTCADESVLRRRLQVRSGTQSTSDATDAELRVISSRYERPEAAEALTLVSMDGSRAAGETLKAAIAALRDAGILPA